MRKEGVGHKRRKEIPFYYHASIAGSHVSASLDEDAQRLAVVIIEAYSHTWQRNPMVLCHGQPSKGTDTSE